MTGYKKKITLCLCIIFGVVVTIISTHTHASIFFIDIKIGIILYTTIFLRKRFSQHTPKNLKILLLDLLRTNKIVIHIDSLKELWTISHEKAIVMISKRKLLWKNHELHRYSLIILMIFDLVFILEST